MNKRHIISCAAIALLMSNAPAIRAQSASAVSTQVAPQPMTSKQIRKANRLLCKKVRHALLEVRQLDSQDIATICHSGVVTLAGTVPEAQQADVAASAARGVDGVASVKNALIVRTHGNY